MVDSREQLLLRTLTFVADTLVDDFDVVDFLHELVERCTSICDCDDVGLVLASAQGELLVMASTSERMRVVEAVQLSLNSGPCIDSFVTGDVITAGTLEEIQRRWPLFAAEVEASGFHSVHAVPLRLRGTVIGSLNFFRDRSGALDAKDIRAAQTIADVATIGLIQERAIREVTAARDQLQHALTARILVEQAKGVISHDRGVDMEEAWALLRQHARATRARVVDVAQNVVERRLRL
ncbi:GAF and ANTAR domain-containing protein [Rathayibacter sp. VKM Ac-2801]|uniref:GAF and ANTAR domain-containing protein n=1 Tax=Rathayibacter sp. VKM Ac-2801 TaxID=2609255 RepID=UPI00131FF9CF|nr:GAF and ANTAR domain-containing protein [Rathayibacter sp. VKM Ac-2801]QHC69293.1 ANTAR domain-containing protein [Rathayibacter sp. VKM Ac-2801]